MRVVRVVESRANAQNIYHYFHGLCAGGLDYGGVYGLFSAGVGRESPESRESPKNGFLDSVF